MQIVTAKSNISDSEAKNIGLKQEMKDLLTSTGTKDLNIDDLSTRLSEASEEYNQKNIIYIRQQNHLSNIQKDYDFNKGRISDANRKIEEDNTKSANLEQEIKYG